MDSIIRNLFEIQRYKGESELEDDFVKSLRIYNAETPAAIKTQTNELLNWIKDPKDSALEVLAFILYCNGKVVGFAMMTYHKQIKVMAYEYVSLDIPYTSFASYFSYIDLLNSYAIQSNYDVLYWITEINNKNGGKEADKESVIFKRVLCLNQFGKIDAHFKTFPMGFIEDSVFDAFIYINSNDRIAQISTSYYLKIVESIKDYYDCWYRRYMHDSDYQKYKMSLNAVYDSIKANIPATGSISISYIDCPLIAPGENIPLKTMPKEQAPKKKHWRFILVMLGIVIASCVIAWFCSFLFKKIGLDISSVAVIIGNVSAALLSAFFAFQGKKP